MFPTGMKGVWCASFPIAVVGRAGHCIERFWWSVRGRYQRALSAGVISQRLRQTPPRARAMAAWLSLRGCAATFLPPDNRAAIFRSRERAGANGGICCGLTTKRWLATPQADPATLLPHRYAGFFRLRWEPCAGSRSTIGIALLAHFQVVPYLRTRQTGSKNDPPRRACGAQRRRRTVSGGSRQRAGPPQKTMGPMAKNPTSSELGPFGSAISGNTNRTLSGLV